ncbi:DUF4097 family beta strand repeat-containing protein [Hymenobacter persicinus]|uniref:DUF4097 domain-containing protein n=1 Tax=Hymenobacter persicinus TaxID=2025506 RepID=A0A4Q5LEJ2_9BACT|nr:DUF4097 family beta strand repeat-containing protein [Hymenobacter persicinus]RYU82847.1 hypothetical protein EWM57_03930 [Hymenobacter persicinus]
MRVSLFVLLLSGLATGARAQSAPVFTTTCGDGTFTSSSSKRYCETRDKILPAPTGQGITIDGRANGGITVKGWDGNEVRVRAKILAWGKSEEEARQLGKSITIRAQDYTLRAESTAEGELGWAVSYEVFVPRRMALTLRTLNGGINLSDLLGDVTFEAANGAISLTNVGGSLRGRTINGGVRIKLAGPKWVGEGLDVQTTNGSITWDLPKNYSARLYAATTVGSVSAGKLPVSKSPTLQQQVVATLGQGGALVKAVTVKGSVKVTQL